MTLNSWLYKTNKELQGANIDMSFFFMKLQLWKSGYNGRKRRYKDLWIMLKRFWVASGKCREEYHKLPDMEKFFHNSYNL